jgi:hypothetical protein
VTLAVQLAMVAEGLVVALGGVYAVVRWLAVQRVTADSAAETARLARAIGRQVDVLLLREWQDRRRINEHDRRWHEHARLHARKGWYG